MLIIPELRKIVIQPPRSGSTALRAAIRSKYELAVSPYRHGEVMMLNYVAYSEIGSMFNAIHDHPGWKIVYILRNPLERMISLWRYMHEVSVERNPKAPLDWIDRVQRDADKPFNEWLRDSTELFNESTAHPIDGSPESHYCTYYQVPAARKSAEVFLAGAPKRSVEIVNFLDFDAYERVLGVSKNELVKGNSAQPLFADTRNTFRHMERHHHTDQIMETLV